MDSATGNDVVNMGMVLQGSSPGVQDTEETREIPTDVLLIEGELLDRVRGRLEQSRVTDALVLAHKRTQLFGNGKGDEEVVSRELAREFVFRATVGSWCTGRWGSGDCRRSERTGCGSAQPSH